MLKTIKKYGFTDTCTKKEWEKIKKAIDKQVPKSIKEILKIQGK